MKTTGHKSFYLVLILFPAFIILEGCSSSRKLSDYPDPDKFYELLNNKAAGKTVRVTTNEGKIITARDGIEANAESLFVLTKQVSRKPAAIPLMLISKTDYITKDPDSPFAFLYTTGGEKIEAYNIRIAADTMMYDSAFQYYKKTAFASSEINRVRYKSRLMALPAGLISGTLAGLLIGMLASASNRYITPDFSSYGGKYSSSNFAGTAIIGAFVGGFISLMIGFNYNFYFY